MTGYGEMKLNIKMINRRQLMFIFHLNYKTKCRAKRLRCQRDIDLMTSESAADRRWQCDISGIICAFRAARRAMQMCVVFHE